MYDPLIEAFNSALGLLSKVNVKGLPGFEKKRKIVFVRRESKPIGTETYRQGAYKPDIILIKSSMHCKSDPSKPSLGWRNILSTVEVKHSDSGGKVKARSVKSKYNAAFEDLRGDGVTESLKPPQSAPQKMVREEYPTYQCMSIALHFSSHSHQVQLRHAPAQESRIHHFRLRNGRSHPKRGAENSTKPQRPPRRGPGAIDRKSKRRKFKVQSTQATRYHLPSTSPTQ